VERPRLMTVLPADDLGLDSAELRRLSPAGTLSRLAALAVLEVPGCSAAHVTVWRDGELAEVAATHPDAAALVDLERASLDALAGPLTAAARDCLPVSCADTLAEERWPGWAAGALARGVRGCTCLVRELPPVTLVLALLSVRPRALDAASAGVADLLAGRAVTDQAKGILIHALGCGADEALAHLRRLAQRRNLKVTEVAAEVIAAYGGGGQARA